MGLWQGVSKRVTKRDVDTDPCTEVGRATVVALTVAHMWACKCVRGMLDAHVTCVTRVVWGHAKTTRNSTHDNKTRHSKYSRPECLNGECCTGAVPGRFSF